MSEKKNGKLSNALKAFLISLVLLIGSSALMSYYASDGGYVKIQRITQIGDDGLTYSGLMMVPKNATNANPAPVFIGCHGGSADARAMEVWGLELARRGYVVLLPDAAGGGSSEKYSVTARGEKYDYIYEPVYTMFKYLTSLPIVQADNVHIAGISQGGNPCRSLAEDFPDQIKSICFINTNQTEPDYFCNVLFYQGTKDTVAQSGKEGIMVDGWLANLWTNFTEFGITSNDQIEVGKLYGDYSKGTARLFGTTRMTHAAGTFNHATIAQMCDFIQNSTKKVPHYIDPENSVWDKREAFGALTFALLMVFVCTTANLLLDSVPFFSKIKRDLPKNVGLRGIGWWISAGLAVLVPILVYQIPWITKRDSNAIWPAYHLNKAIKWLAILFVFGVIMFFVFHKTQGKKEGGNLDTYGLTYEGEKKLNLMLIWRAFLLSLAVEFVVITFLTVLEDLTGLTPHCWFINFSPITTFRLKYVPAYYIIYLVCFLMSSLSMNVERGLPSSGDERKDTIKAIVVNSLIAAAGFGILLLVQWFFGYNAMTEAGQKLALNNLVDHSQFGLSITIGVVAGINTYLYRKTGTIWTGAFVVAILIAINAVMNNSI